MNDAFLTKKKGEWGVSTALPPEDITKTSGGRRRGAGRPKGSKNKRSFEVLKNHVLKGMTPVEYMIKTMRNHALPAERRDRMAIAVAPYIHPRLMTHEVSGKAGGALQMEVYSRVVAYVPDNARRVAPAAPANDASAPAIAAVKGNGGSHS